MTRSRRMHPLIFPPNFKAILFLREKLQINGSKFFPLTDARFVLVDWPQFNQLILSRFVGSSWRYAPFSQTSHCTRIHREAKRSPARSISIKKKADRIRLLAGVRAYRASKYEIPITARAFPWPAPRN